MELQSGSSSTEQPVCSGCGQPCSIQDFLKKNSKIGIYEKWNENINHTIVEESNEVWKEVNNPAENAMSGMIKMLEKCKKLKNKRTLPRTWKDYDEQIMFYR
ncbi:9592_t:CDS:2, partial [Racocetra persica]